MVLEEFGKCRLWGSKPPFGPRLALEVAVPLFVVVALLLSAAVVPVSLGENIFVCFIAGHHQTVSGLFLLVGARDTRSP